MKAETNTTGMWKNVAIVVLTATAVYLAWDAYQQHDRAEQLESDVVEMGAMLDQNALETQNAMEAFAEIEINLAEIRESEGYLLTNLDAEEFEDMPNAHQRIMSEIASVERLIEINKSLINDLEGQVEDKDSRLANYKKSVGSLEQRIADYKKRSEQLIAESETLREELQSVSTINQEVTRELAFNQVMLQDKSEELKKREQELRTGYYAVGTFKELEESNVLEKQGGLLGIGATKKFKEDFNRKRFTEVDIYHYTAIPIYAKDARLISNHDSESYAFVEDDNGDITWMNILDPKRFWENTKYMVVEIKGGQFDKTTAMNQ